jgi:hypothetical protein
MKWDAKNPHAPFDPFTGDMMHYPETAWTYKQVDGKSVHFRQPPEWRLVKPFEATMTIHGASRGRSAAYFTFTDEDGVRYPVFMADVEKLLKQATIAGGKVTAVWAARKRGQNYGIGLA